MSFGIIGTQTICGDRGKQKKFAEQLLDILPHEQAKILGRRLTAQGGWMDKSQLAAELQRDLFGSSASRLARPEKLISLVAQKNRQDFADQRVVDLDGWVLSQTEAKLCALHALSDAHA